MPAATFTPLRRLFSISALCALTALSPVSSAAPFFGHTLMPGFEFRDVVSIKGRQYQNLIRQETDFSCGAASLATILKYAYKLDVSERDVLEGMFSVSNPELVQQKGFSLLDIKNYINGIGMRGRGYKVKADALEKIRVPTIVLLDLKGYKHFVVLKKTEPERVYIADPALGNKVITRAEFEQQWNGIVFAIIGQGIDRDSPLVDPAPPLTARALHDVRAPLTDAELIDFGFRHADLF
ncbi:MAG: C39 family peptidase [Marinobacterium sp.]|nr:C39 family peptidase [Marinobacterium sp.]